MEYSLSTRERRLVLGLDQSWDINPEFEFLILEKLDSDNSKDPETRKNLSGIWRVFEIANDFDWKNLKP